MNKKDDINSIFNELKEDKYVKIEININESQEDDETTFSADYEPSLPIEVDADSLSEAQDLAVKALQQYIKTESEDREIDVNFENVKIELSYQI
ncbi:MAG: hypothetical protein ACXAD7_05430 [Candidatus Kariarchaeaceae archaeon]|jgi:hypothetical protein